VPVLHFFSGAHDDYHKPSDRAERINAAGAAEIAALVEDLAAEVAARPMKLTYRAVPAPPPRGDLRSYGASLGTIPDYAGTPDQKPGVLLAGVRPGGPADTAGLRRGDLLQRIGKYEIRTIEDFEFALRNSHPGEQATVTVEREGKPLSVQVIFGQRRY
jgi:S1-C subfamily serine protease